MADGINTFGSVLSGAAGGAASGSAFGPVGTAAGAIIGGITGGAKQARANEAQNIPGSDPAEVLRLQKLQRTMKQLETGTDPLTRLNISESRAAGRTAQQAVSRVTGGDVGSTISALQRVQKGVQTGINKNVAQAALRVPYFDTAAGGLTSRIADRKLQLQLLNRGQRTAESAQYQTDANVSGQALLGAIGGGLDLGFGNLGGGRGQAGQNIPVSSNVLAPGQSQVANPQAQPQQTILGAGTQQAPILADPSVGQVQPIPGQSFF